MRIADLIRELQRAENLYGNLPVYTFDAIIRDVTVEPSEGGIIVSCDPTELVVEFS